MLEQTDDSLSALDMSSGDDVMHLDSVDLLFLEANSAPASLNLPPISQASRTSPILPTKVKKSPVFLSKLLNTTTLGVRGRSLSDSEDSDSDSNEYRAHDIRRRRLD